MRVITVISPDKLSLSMFCDFYRSVFIGDNLYKILDMNCLNSIKAQNLIVQDFFRNNKDLSETIVKYKIKSQTKLQIPESLEIVSNYIIKFDIFSTHPELTKDSDGKGKDIIERWTKNISKMDL